MRWCDACVLAEKLVEKKSVVEDEKNDDDTRLTWKK